MTTTETAPAATTATWTPCRRHLTDALLDIAARARQRATWTMPVRVWEQIMRDPELKSNWTEHRNGRVSRTLFDLPVTVDNHHQGVRLILPVDCQEARP